MAVLYRIDSLKAMDMGDLYGQQAMCFGVKILVRLGANAPHVCVRGRFAPRMQWLSP